MNTIRLEFLGSGRWALHTKYHEKFPVLAKKFPGFIWNKDTRYWVGYSDGLELLLPALQAEGICRLAGDRAGSFRAVVAALSHGHRHCPAFAADCCTTSFRRVRQAAAVELSVFRRQRERLDHQSRDGRRRVR